MTTLNHFRFAVSALFLAAPFSASAAPEPADGIAFFDQEVLPILKKNCFECHGGEDKLKGDLRLTSRAGLLKGGELGSAIDEEEPSKSLFLDMINYVGDDYEMPPKDKLPAEQIATLTKWIEMGAPYNPEKEIHGELVESKGHIQESDFDYWAYRKVERPEIPETETAHPIDAFILAKLKEAGISPNPRASRQTLIRRATYDLTGLPPKPGEVEKFVNDPRPDDVVWEELIDDLLARPQYGEKWARHWLDLMRYAETNGFERDNPKPHIWRYRDYVITAFNEDKPYDRFIVEQLAGDEIENPTMESIAATGYHRLMQWDDEPADRKQHTYDVLADNVDVTSKAFLGTTIGCARCHNHKADPITQRDYYSFMAFFHGVTPYKTPGTIVPWASESELAAFKENQEVRIQDARDQIAALEDQLRAYLKKAGKLSENPQAEVETLVENARGSGDAAEWFFTTSQPDAAWKEVGQKVKSWTRAQGGFGTRVPNAEGKTAWNSSDIWMRTSFGLQELPETLVLDLYHDGDVEVYLNGVEIYRASGYLTNYETIELGRDALDALQTGKNVLAVHCRQTGGGQYIDVALRTGAQAAGNLNEALKSGGSPLQKELAQHFARDVVKELDALKKKITAIRQELPGTPINAVTETEPQPMHIHVRGSAHAPGDPVEPAFPAVMNASFDPVKAEIPADFESKVTAGRRLALAEWIASADNPLTSRVMVNRLWQHHFGRGIVPSTSDFGKLGEDPTHLELLDWLAAEFVERGWSLKKMHKLLMLSEAYQRSSTPSETALETDPANRLFWRYNMRRLTAEEIRDSILAVSGNLNLKMGGPWVNPPLPEEVLATASRPDKAWPASSPREAVRRSVYVHIKRSLRIPFMVGFDQADTDSACAVRFATTVPTQALNMLNSELVNAQADVFAERCREQAGATLEAQIRYGLRIALQREPDDGQVQELLKMVEKLQSEAGLSEKEAMDRFALLTLNLNEFMYLD